MSVESDGASRQKDQFGRRTKGAKVQDAASRSCLMIQIETAGEDCVRCVV